jgi:hypothetical protein
VVLYIEGFGRYDAVSVRYADHVLGLRFLCTERKRDRLKSLITEYIECGAIDPTRLSRPNPLRAAQLIAERPNGEKILCHVLDVSLFALSLKTTKRPPINERLRIGRSVARVTCHHERGIGVELMAPGPQPRDQ